MQKEITRVVFRKWPEAKVEGVRAGRIFALFPEISAGHPGHQCQSYEQGQHRAVVYDLCIRTSRSASPKDYANLKAELEEIGYRLEVVTRITPAMVEARWQAAKKG